MPPPGQLAPFLRGLLRKAGWLGLAVTLLDTLLRSNGEAQVRAAIERFHLGPDKAGDVAAALAFVWASSNRSLLIVGPPGGGSLGTLLPDSAQDAVAERVMRAVQKDPGLLDRAMSGDAEALAAIHSAVQAVASKLGIITRNDEERRFVDKLDAEGKNAEEIQAALDEFRRRAGVPSRLDLPRNPDDLLKSGWIETMHPEAAKTGHREFENPQTGEKVLFDKGRTGETGSKAVDHYHRLNASSTGKRDLYLDVHGNPVPRGSQRSHIVIGKP